MVKAAKEMKRVHKRYANGNPMKNHGFSVPLTRVSHRQERVCWFKQIWLLILTSAIASTTFHLHGQKPDLIGKPTPLYSANSIWNKSIPSNPTLDPESGNMIQGLVQSISNHGFVMNLNEWSIPVYRATPETPRTSVTLAADWAPHTTMQGVPIPDFAAPDPLNDGHMVIINADGTCHYDLWQTRRIGKRWVASWGNAIPLDGNGIYEHGLGARAGGFGLLAGLIWPEELAAGEINHALVFATGETREGGPVAPATASDGVNSGNQAIPIGAHLQLDPNFDLESLSHPFLKTIARALQIYGMYCGDTTGGSVDLYALNPISVRSNPYASSLPNPSAPFPSLAEIPAAAFRVLEMPAPNPDAGSEVSLNGCNEFTGAWMNGVRDLAVVDGHAFLADGIMGLRILNVTSPSSPVFRSSIETEEPATSIDVLGSLAFVGTAGAGVRIINVETISEPKELGDFGASDGLSIAATTIHNNHLYVLSNDPPALFAVDISDPSAPEKLSEMEDINIFDTPRDLVINYPYVYVVDQVTQLQVIDISNPTKLTAIPNDTDNEFFPNSIQIHNQKAFVTDEDSGLVVFDLTSPTAPQFITTLKLPDFAFGISIQGERAFVANGGGGLQVVDISQSNTPKIIGSIQPEIGYARSVSTDQNQIYLGSIGGGVLVFESKPDSQFVKVGSFENKGQAEASSPSEPVVISPPQTIPVEPEIPIPTPPTITLRLIPLAYSEETGFSFEVVGPNGLAVTIEISDDLEDWETLEQLVLSQDNRILFDEDAGDEPNTFYRLSSAP